MAEEEEVKEKEKKEKREKKIYKGEVRQAGELASKGVGTPIPVQPIKQTFSRAGFQQKLPPTFIVTKFSPGYYPDSRLMHYYDTKRKIATQMDVPGSLELNVLSGRRKEELDAEWSSTLRSELGRLSRRISCTIGTDPEIFVVNKAGVVPAWTFLGSKTKPGKWTYGSMDGELYWDGFQAEFTTPGHLTCLIEMSNAIHGALATLNSAKPKGSKLSISSVVPVNPEILATSSEEHVAFGCAPSKNVHGLRGNMQEGRVVPFRFAGGHIHMGLDDAAKAKIPEIVRALDTVVGLSCVSLFANYDSPVRRQFYGQAGEYRTPPHGLEYRVLSNAWLAHPVVMHLVFDLTRAVAGLVNSGIHISSVWSAKEDDTLSAIMNSDVELARKILTENKEVFFQIFATAGHSYQADNSKKKLWDAFISGMETLVDDPSDLETNWSLGKGYWQTQVRTFSAAAGHRKKL